MIEDLSTDEDTIQLVRFNDFPLKSFHLVYVDLNAIIAYYVPPIVQQQQKQNTTIITNKKMGFVFELV